MTGTPLGSITDDHLDDHLDERRAPDPTVADIDIESWARVCRLDQLTPYRGVAALVDGQQVAVFRFPDDQIYAIGNFDPFSHAPVLSRGVVGDAKGVPKVASPVYKQSFDLRTGRCLDDPEVSVPTYPVRVDDEGWVHLAVPREDSS